MFRIWQVILIATFVPLSWLLMMAVHELGHVLGALLTGGRVVGVYLSPLAFSYTFVDPNPRPLIVAWMGSVVGILLPLSVVAMVTAQRYWMHSRQKCIGKPRIVEAGGMGRWHAQGELLARWFAGFCMIANGAYLGAGWMDGVGDAGDLVNHGAAVWQLLLFGAVTLPVGLLLWHGTGPAFGLGEAKGNVHPAVAMTSAAMFIAVTTVMSMVGVPP